MKKFVLAILTTILLCFTLNGCGVIIESIAEAPYISYNDISRLEISDEVRIHAKVFQTLSDYSALCRLHSDDDYLIYYYSGEEILYDDKIIRGKVRFAGTYTYETKSGIVKTVPSFIAVRDTTKGKD